MAELAKRWHLSSNTVRRLVADEPGVIKLTVGPLLRNRRKRHLVSLRIPERVAVGVHARYGIGWQIMKEKRRVSATAGVDQYKGCGV